MNEIKQWRNQVEDYRFTLVPGSTKEERKGKRDSLLAQIEQCSRASNACVVWSQEFIKLRENTNFAQNVQFINTLSLLLFRSSAYFSLPLLRCLLAAFKHQRRSTEESVVIELSVETVLDAYQSVYEEKIKVLNEKKELLTVLMSLLKEVIHVSDDLAELLNRLKLQLTRMTTPTQCSSAEPVLKIISFLPAKFLDEFVCGEMFINFSLKMLDENLELSLLVVLAKIESPSVLQVLDSAQIIPSVLKRAMEYILSDVETSASCPNFAVKLSKLMVRCPEQVLPILSAKSQQILLPSLKLKANWPARLAETYWELSRQVCKHPIPGFKTFVFSGVENVANYVMGGLRESPVIPAKYVLIFARLAIGEEIEKIFRAAMNSLEDPHKAMSHPLTLLTGVLPLFSKSEPQFYPELLDYCLESIDTTNLFKTTAALAFLDVALTQHGLFTLHDLSEDPSADPRFLNVSTTFPAWSSALLERMLLASLTIGGKAAAAAGSMSSEGLERMSRAFMINIWWWVSANSSADYFEIFQDFINANPAMSKSARSMVGKLLERTAGIVARVTDWLLSKPSLNEQNIALLSHAVRYMGADLMEKIPQLTLLIERSTFSKPLVKLVQRISECLANVYPMDWANGTKEWWRNPNQEIKWHIPSEIKISAVLKMSQNWSFSSPFFRAVLYGVSLSPTPLSSTLPLTLLRRIEQPVLSDLGLWLKTVRSVARVSPGPIFSSRLAGLRLGDLGREFTFVYGKEFACLDETRFEFIQQHAVPIYTLRENEEIISEIARLVPMCLEILLSSHFDKLRAKAAQTIVDLLEVASPSNRGIVSTMIGQITQIESMDIHSAKGLGLLVNTCSVLRIAIVEEFLVIFFEFLTRKISDENAEPLVGILRDLHSVNSWEQNDDDSILSLFVVNTLKKVTVDKFWKIQGSFLAMSYIVWNRKCLAVSESILNSLCNVVKLADHAPLPLSVATILIVWLQSVNGLVELPDETLMSVAKMFAQTKRFAAPNAVSTTLETLAIQMDEAARKNRRRFPYCVSNKGIVEANVAFWASSNCSASVADEILAWCSNSVDDDTHCVGLEVLAAGICDEQTTSKFINSEILRSDGSMLPTIATAVRMSMFRCSQPVLFPDEVLTNEKFVNKTFNMLLKPNWRYLLVLYNAMCLPNPDCLSKVITDYSFCFQFSTSQVAEYTSSILACFMKVGVNLSEQFQTLLSRNEIEANLFLLKTDFKLIKSQRKVSEWSVRLFPVALELLGNEVKETARNEATAYLKTAAEYISLSDIKTAEVSSSKGKDVLLECITRAIIKQDWCLDFRKCYVDAIDAALSTPPLMVNETSDAGWLKTCKESIEQILLVCPECTLQALVLNEGDLNKELFIVRLCAIVSVASLSYEVPQFGIAAVSKLGMECITIKAGIKRLAETTLSQFFKGLSDKGLREQTEKKFNPDALDIINAGKSKHSYIS